VSFFKLVIRGSRRGQALVELTLIFPMLLTLSLGAVEIANLIYTYQIIHHVTAQGANITARLPAGKTVDEIITQVVDAACPVMSQGAAASCPTSNASRWRVIYTEIGPDTSVPEPQPYIVKKQRVLGATTVEDAKRVCKDCPLSDFVCNPGEGCIDPKLANLDKVAPGQSFYAVEVFYDYTPITVLGNFVGGTFADKLYERSIF
jgi:hypothetical protein